MIGEMRDTETAQIAVQSALTGHLVLSTLHTNTAAGAITRLEDMGVERFFDHGCSERCVSAEVDPETATVASKRLRSPMSFSKHRVWQHF